MDDAVTKLRYLFSEDPLTQADGDDDRFCSWYNVEAQYPKFLARAEQLCDEEQRSEEHTSELQSLMRISYAVFCLKKKKNQTIYTDKQTTQQQYKNTLEQTPSIT